MTHRKRLRLIWPIVPASVAAMLMTLAAAPRTAAAQALVRVGDPGRADYSELHERLRRGTPAADSVLRIMRSSDPRRLWRTVRAALADRAPWNDGILALTRIAELHPRAYADSARRLERALAQGRVKLPPGRETGDLASPLRAIALAVTRARHGDAGMRSDIFGRVPAGDYSVADAWTLGRMRGGTADSIAARFAAAPTAEEKVRWLTLLTFNADTSQVPLLARVYAAPDSFGIPPRYGARASDALLWIGTPASLAALRGARAAARARGSYDDPALSNGGFDFLANDSSAVISRTGRWLDEWIALLKTR
jgi:hypothetical protein